MKKLLAVVALVAVALLVGCSTHVTDPMSLKQGAQGNPNHEDDGGGGGGGAPPMAFDASASGSTVSVALDNFDASGAFGYQFTFTLSGGLALNPNLSAITKGSWLSAGSIFSATQNSDGSYTVVGARLVGQGECAHAGGVLANIATTGHGTFTLVGSPSGAVTPSPTLKDCSNADLSIQYGTASVGL
jgi:hypothetical protein